MAAWNKLYVVGDGKRKGNSGSPPVRPTPPPLAKKKRGGIRYFWVLMFTTVAFGSGAFLGLTEDYEGELFLMEMAPNVLGAGVLEANIPDGVSFMAAESERFLEGNHIFDDYEKKLTIHFRERMDCREIGMSEIDHVLRFGRVHKYFPMNKGRWDNSIEPKFNLVGKTNLGREILVSFTVSSASRLTLITTYPFDGKKDDCD